MSSSHSRHLSSSSSIDPREKTRVRTSSLPDCSISPHQDPPHPEGGFKVRTGMLRRYNTSPSSLSARGKGKSNRTISYLRDALGQYDANALTLQLASHLPSFLRQPISSSRPQTALSLDDHSPPGLSSSSSSSSASSTSSSSTASSSSSSPSHSPSPSVHFASEPSIHIIQSPPVISVSPCASPSSFTFSSFKFPPNRSSSPSIPPSHRRSSCHPTSNSSASTWSYHPRSTISVSGTSWSSNPSSSSSPQRQYRRSHISVSGEDRSIYGFRGPEMGFSRSLEEARDQLRQMGTLEDVLFGHYDTVRCSITPSHVG
ncbi:MAG: hypothetical protein DHS80DRAFT_21113 [Piptocephalis tieghemiana]|nr:MAG: hypothetical protein DHS80DRAFT_21113 [Piptocephalis tieghemiana]